jgi:thiol-disulfide isomerase/thioredoxin
MRQFIIAFIFCLIFQLRGLSQSRFRVSYQFDGTQKRGLYFQLLRPLSNNPGEHLPAFPLLSIDTGITNTITCVFAVRDTSICLFADGFGHESFIIPGDQLTIRVKKMPKAGTRGADKLNGKFMSPFFYEFDYQGPNKNIYTLFDSLTYHTGGLFAGGDIGFKEVGHDVKVFFDTVTNQYQARLKYLDYYARKYKLPKTIHQLAFMEIKADYVGNLLEPMQNIVKDLDFQDYPRGYIDSLNNINFNDPRSFFRSREFALKAYYYMLLYQNRPRLSSRLDDEETLRRVFRTINKHYDNKQIQERLLATLLINNHKHPFSSFDSVLNVYHERYPSSVYRKNIDSLYFNYKSRPRGTVADVLAGQLVDPAGNKATLSDQVGEGPTVIDCWASWCVPCLQQFPFSEELEKKYAGKVKFLYLSFDREPSKWRMKSQTLGLKNSFLLPDDFKSSLANYFEITAIPRYIIINNKNEVVSPDAPRPSNKAALEKILNKLLKN